MLQSNKNSVFDVADASLKNMLSEVPGLCYNPEYDLYFFYHKEEIHSYEAVFSSVLLCKSISSNIRTFSAPLPKEISSAFTNVFWGFPMIDMTVNEKINMFCKKSAVECALIDHSL